MGNQYQQSSSRKRGKKSAGTGPADRFINFRCQAKLRERVAIYAIRNNLTHAQVCVEALTEYLEKRKG